MTTPVVDRSIPLSLLGAGRSARVSAVLGSSELVQRLRELGLRDGAWVQMIQPGRPCLIRLGDQRLGVRTEELQGVLVEPGPAA